MGGGQGRQQEVRLASCSRAGKGTASPAEEHTELKELGRQGDGKRWESQTHAGWDGVTMWARRGEGAAATGALQGGQGQGLGVLMRTQE